jgi:putative SOS response-associated peptidase YedK
MCGRYVTPEVAEAERNLMVHWLEYERSYNVVPTQAAAIDA